MNNNNKTIPIFILLAIATIAMAIPTTSITIANVEAQKFEKPSDPNDWGNVISSRAQEESMRHSSNPFPGNDPEGTLPQDIDRETPREGVGNVQLNDDEIPKHPAFHAQALCETFPGAPGCDAIDTTDDPVKDGSEEEVEESESVEKEAEALTSQEEDEEEESNNNNNNKEDEEEVNNNNNEEEEEEEESESDKEEDEDEDKEEEKEEDKDDNKKEDKDE